MSKFCIHDVPPVTNRRNRRHLIGGLTIQLFSTPGVSDQFRPDLMAAMIVATLILCARMAASTKDAPPFINPGTPPGISPSFDCAARVSAWNYGKYLLPQRGDFRTLFEALELQACGLDTPATMDAWTPPTFSVASGQHSVFADAEKGDDANTGTIKSPVKTIAKAVEIAEANSGASTVLLRAGTFHVTKTVQVTSDDLTIQNYNGEEVVVSGGVPLQLKDKWMPYNVSRGWEIFDDSNNVYGKAHDHADSGDIKYIGTYKTLQECKDGLTNSSKGPFLSFTYHTLAFGGDFAGQCFGVTRCDRARQSPNNRFRTR